MKNIFEYIGKNDDDKPFINFIVSNPPYQRETGSGAVATYHHFMNIAEEIAEKVSMIYPARWMTNARGTGIQEFQRRELLSKNYRDFIVDTSKNIFSQVIIKGGVNWFFWDASYSGTTHYSYHNIYEERESLLNGFHKMVVNPDYYPILQKCIVKDYIKAYPRNYFGLHIETDYKVEALEKEFLKFHKKSEGIKNYYSGKSGGVNTCYLPQNVTSRDITKWKVLASRTADSNAQKTKVPRLNRLFIAKPYEICSGSFLVVSEFDTEEEANNCVLYLKTSLMTFLFGALLQTSDTKASSYEMIPRVDFKTGKIYDKQKYINFKNIRSLDKELYEIYNISGDEQIFIESVVKDWKNKYSLTADGFF